jgi:hypothetical protein
VHPAPSTDLVELAAEGYRGVSAVDDAALGSLYVSIIFDLCGRRGREYGRLNVSWLTSMASRRGADGGVFCAAGMYDSWPSYAAPETVSRREESVANAGSGHRK